MQESHLSDLELFLASKQGKAEDSRNIRIRQQMREQDKRRFRDPDPVVGPQVFNVYVWRAKRKQWFQVGEVTRTTHFTPKAMNILRRKFHKKIADNEIMRVVEQRVVKLLGGAGGPPQMPPLRRKPSRQQQRKLRLAAARDRRRMQREKAARGRKRRPNTDRRLSKCDVGYRVARGRGKRCPHRAPWLVAYTDGKRHTRVIRKCCTRHAWDDRLLPAQARHVVRVERKSA